MVLQCAGGLLPRRFWSPCLVQLYPASGLEPIVVHESNDWIDVRFVHCELMRHASNCDGALSQDVCAHSQGIRADKAQLLEAGFYVTMIAKKLLAFNVLAAREAARISVLDALVQGLPYRLTTVCSPE